MADTRLRTEHLMTLGALFTQLRGVTDNIQHIINRDPGKRILLRTYLCALRDLHAEAINLVNTTLSIGGLTDESAASALDDAARHAGQSPIAHSPF